MNKARNNGHQRLWVDACKGWLWAVKSTWTKHPLLIMLGQMTETLLAYGELGYPLAICWQKETRERQDGVSLHT